MNFSYSHAQLAELISEFDQAGVREAMELESLPDILKGVEYFIDVGANVGQYTFHAAKHLRSARLLAIEANPYLVPALANTIQNLRSQNDQGNEYDLYSVAIADVVGSFKFYVSKFPTLSSVFARDSALAVDVPATKLDDFYRPVPTLIKIDIEGAEYRAIRSATRFLESKNTSFFVELHGWGDATLRKYPIHVCWLFLTSGYATRKIGTHYLFYRGSFPNRFLSFARCSPYLILKYLVYRLGINAPLSNLRNSFDLSRHS